MTQWPKTAAGKAPRPKSPMLSIVWFTVVFASVATFYTGLIFDFWAVGFLLILIGSSYLAFAGYAVASSRAVRVSRPCSTTTRFNLIIGAISLLGIVAIFYDRTSIRGIDYIDMGIAAARAELNRVGERGGLISIFGNLFSVIIYLPLVNLIFDWEKWGRQRYLVLAIVVAGLAGLTYLTAGRTVVLIAVALAAAAMLGRGALGMPRLPSFLTTGRLVASIAAISVLFGMIFALRADAFGAANAGDYLSQLCIHLSQPAIEIMSQCSSTPYVSGSKGVDDFANYSTAVLLYAFHVAWVGDVIIADQNPGLTTTFVGIQDMFLSRFGYQISATDYDGYFIPAAPGLVYDFGYLAMALTFILIGVLFGLFQRSMQTGHLFLGRIAFCYTGAALMLAVLISPANLPFYFLSIAAIGIIAVPTKMRSGVTATSQRRVASLLQAG